MAKKPIIRRKVNYTPKQIREFNNVRNKTLKQAIQLNNKKALGLTVEKVPPPILTQRIKPVKLHRTYEENIEENHVNDAKIKAIESTLPVTDAFFHQGDARTLPETEPRPSLKVDSLPLISQSIKRNKQLTKYWNQNSSLGFFSHTR